MAMTSSRQLTRAAFAPAFRSTHLAPALSFQRRYAATTSNITDAEAYARLNGQRKVRPISPHFTIYQPQLTWLSSIANRVTGSALSVGLYGFALSYLALPALGVPMDSDTLVQTYASAPEWFKYGAKGLVALPFSFHTFNGLRHLGWDMGYFLDLKTSYIAGYTVIGATAVSTVALAML